MRKMKLSLAKRPREAREEWLGNLLDRGLMTTPALAIDSSEVSETLNLFRHHLPEAKIFYAVKANNSPKLLEFLAGEGVSFDVASAKEIEDLVSLGISPSRMILSNPVKGPATIKRFFENEMRLVSIDNPTDLAALSAHYKKLGLTHDVGVLIRIRISSTDVQIDLNSKFGCTAAESVDLLKLVMDSGFKPRGIQFHVGTQSWNANNFRVGVDTALKAMDSAREKYGVRCDTINIGGGYPDPHVAHEAGGLERFFEELRKAIQPALDRGLNIIAEPGRVLVSGACSAVCSVIGKSVRNGVPWLYLDDGAYGLFSGKFFDHKEFEFHLLRQYAESSNRNNGKLVPYVVAGPTCDSIDVIAHPILLPSNIEIGDILCTHNMGAYSIVTACSFNGFG